MTAKFGLNERERILRLAAGVDADQDTSTPVSNTANTPDASCLAAIKRGPSFFAALDISQRPIAPFINRPKLPRILRQKALDKLLGQHLALAAVSSGLGDNPGVAAATERVRNDALVAAVEQEEGLYQQCSIAQTYQNIAARATALDWKTRLNAVKEAQYEQALAEESRKKRSTTRAEHGCHSKKSRPAPKEQAAIEKIVLENTAEDGCSPAAVKEGLPLALLEEDLDWGQALPEGAAEVSAGRPWVRRRIVDAMEDVDECKELSPEDRLLTANRCCDKVLRKWEEEGGRKEAQERLSAPSALRTLVKEYARYVLNKKKMRGVIDN